MFGYVKKKEYDEVIQLLQGNIKQHKGYQRFLEEQ